VRSQVAVSEDWLPCATDIAVPLSVAYEFQELLEAGVVSNRAEIARRYGLSRARVAQVMSLLRLPDEIQQYVVRVPPWEQRRYSRRRLRGIAVLPSQPTQLAALVELRRTAQESQCPQ